MRITQKIALMLLLASIYSLQAAYVSVKNETSHQWIPRFPSRLLPPQPQMQTLRSFSQKDATEKKTEIEDLKKQINNYVQKNENLQKLLNQKMELQKNASKLNNQISAEQQKLMEKAMTDARAGKKTTDQATTNQSIQDKTTQLKKNYQQTVVLDTAIAKQYPTFSDLNKKFQDANRALQQITLQLETQTQEKK